MRAQLVAGIFLTILAVLYWLAADAIPQSPLSGGVGADGLPKLLALALGVLSVSLIIQSLFYIARQRRVAAVAFDDEDEKATEWHAHLRAFGLIAIGLVFSWLLPILGYAVTGGLLLITVSAYTGLKPSMKMLAFGVFGAVVFYAIFVLFLQVPMPVGMWPRLLAGG